MTESYAETRPRPPSVLFGSVAAVTALAVAYLLLFPERTDYVGHFLAGAGGTYLLLVAIVVSAPERPELIVLGAAGAILLGVGTEATVFRLAEFDLVDLANQSLGAVIAGIGMLTTRYADRSGLVASLFGTLFVVVGFISAFA